MQSFNQPPHGSTLQGWMRRNNEAGHFFSQQEKAAEAKARQPGISTERGEAAGVATARARLKFLRSDTGGRP
jgi:hypothetical protein